MADGAFWNVDSSISDLLLVVNIKDKPAGDTEQCIQDSVETVSECDETDVCGIRLQL